MTCILWHGYVNEQGYGVIGFHRRPVKAHRHIYAECLGPIPAGLDVHHTCGEKACINPAHMELLTRSEHTKRHGGPPWALGVAAAAGKKRAITHCPRGHEYTSANTYTDKRGCRSCRACNLGSQSA